MGKNFEFYASIGVPRLDKQKRVDGPDITYGIDIVSFGVRVGREVSDINPNKDGALLDIIASLTNMKRPSPITFSLVPSNNGKQLIMQLKQIGIKKINISAATFSDRGQVLVKWDYDFEGISRVNIKSERQKGYQRVDAYFQKMTSLI